MADALAALLNIYRVSQTTTVSTVTPEYIRNGRVHILEDKDVPPYVTILRIHGPLPVRDHRQPGGGAKVLAVEKPPYSLADVPAILGRFS